MIRKLLFDNGVTTVGINFTFSRGDVAIADDGSTLAANAPRFSNHKLLLPAPNLTGRQTASDQKDQRVWGGRWKNGSTACMVEKWTDSSGPTPVVRVGISVGTFTTTDPHCVKDIGGNPNLVNEAGWRHEPRSFIVADGIVIAFCSAFESNASKAVSVCYWDENVSGGGTLAWKFKYRGPSVQDGKLRGRDWMAQGPFIPPNGTFSDGSLKDFFVTWVDYRANEQANISLGGQLFIMRCSRTAANGDWTIHDPILLYQETLTGPLLPNEWTSGLDPLGMHYHSAAVTFPGGGTDGKRMIVTLAVGDSFPNNRLVNFVRDDYTTYNDGPAPLISPADEFPPQPESANGWTTYEDREGQRVRVIFTDGDYESSPHRLTSAQFQNFSHAVVSGQVTPVVLVTGVTGGPQVLGITGKQNATTVLLDRAPGGTITEPLGGYIYTDRSVQGVWQAPTNSRTTIIHGGDEQGNSIYRYTITDASQRIDLAIAHGVMTDCDHGYSTQSHKNLGWLGLLGAFKLGGTGPDYTVTEYLALVAPNSFTNWTAEPRAVTLFWSPDGLVWGELYAPSFAGTTEFQVPSAFFGSDVFFGRPVSGGLHSSPAPTTATIVQARPLSISSGGTNILRSYTESGLPSVERVTAPGTANSVEVVDRAALPLAVPLPACNGPVLRLKAREATSLGVWKLTDPLAIGTSHVFRARLWMYRLPGSRDTSDPNVLPPCAEAGISFELLLHPSSGADIRSPLLEAGRVAGTGWTPITLSWTPSNLTAQNYELRAQVYTLNNAFQRQDVLVAWDGVMGDPSYIELPGRPLLQIPPPPPPPPASQVSLAESFQAVFVQSIPAPPPSPEWSVFAALRLPDSGPDVFTANRIADPDDITLFTLRESPSKYLRVVLERGISTNRIKLFDHTGASAAVEGPASGDDGVGFAQPFFFLRGRQILLGVSRYASGENHFYRAWASAGGTRVKVVDGIALADVRPTQARSGDNTKANPDPAEFFGFWFDDTNATSAADGRAKLHNPTLFLS